MAKELRTLGWDYFMFVAFVLFTVFAPLWSRIFGKKKERSKADYVFATGGISIFAIMLSIARGTLGVRSVLGYPSELYYRGSAMWEVIYGMMSAYPIVCFVFVPVYFNLGITSVYQYLDLRFKSRLVRCLAAGTYIVRQICNLGVTVYTPSVALSTVIGIPYWVSIVSISLICIFFTLLGGLKAAINADVIQTVTVILVTVVVIIKGLIEAGGAERVYQVNRDNGRLSFFNFTGDMTVRVDTLSAWLGQLFMSLSQFGCQQNFMQRYISLKSLSAVKQAMTANIPIIFFFFSLSWLSGMVIYATYINCDPLADGYIQKPDEIMPFFVEDQLAVIPGFLGIFMAMLFNGALCMMVSNLNSLSTVICEDFLSLIPAFKSFNDKQQLTVIKLVCIVCGLLVMGIAFGVGMLSGVIESSMLAFSATSGPLLGCFVLAMLVPFANWKGTATGMIASCMSVIWIVFGNASIETDNSSEWLPTSTEGCTNNSFSSSIHRPVSWIMDYTTEFNTTNAQFIAETAAPERTPLEYFYSISYMYYSLLGATVCILVGCIVSYLTLSDDDQYDGALLHPLILKWCQRSNSKKAYYLKNCVDISTLSKSAQVNAAFDVQTEPHILKEKELCEKANVTPIQLVLNTSNTKPAQINNNNTISTISDSVRSDTDANDHTMGSYIKKIENERSD